ncbi:unnamed protein product, partial [Oppiella nova]
VGKSALIVQLVHGKFDDKYDPTIEDTYRHRIVLDGHHYLLDVIDTAGTKQFSEMRDIYIKRGHGFILVYSIGSEASFTEIQGIRQQILDVRGKADEEMVPMVLVGNKCDLFPKDREVNQFVAQLTINKQMNDCPFFETSAKEGIHIQEVFTDIV